MSLPQSSVLEIELNKLTNGACRDEPGSRGEQHAAFSTSQKLVGRPLPVSHLQSLHLEGQYPSHTFRDAYKESRPHCSQADSRCRNKLFTTATTGRGHGTPDQEGYMQQTHACFVPILCRSLRPGDTSRTEIEGMQPPETAFRL
ncbi:hypothetical protein CLCR_07732 [Cladophialophora carrionii]|uniref:Uncharacterized protein n=1 Tax=Cladophialophora carrionii TaxID=86049 RepID=A0A1C1CQD7_9EURO|nr:hypothetical protein CLCR_07732 [Cladophialophora carrionii]